MPRSPESMPKAHGIAALWIFAAALAGYARTFHFPFVFDDAYTIVLNPAIRNAFDLVRIWRFNPPRFLTIWSFAWNYAAAGLNPMPYHMTNLFIHALGALGVYGVMGRILETPVMEKEGLSQSLRLKLSLLAALLFLCHPLQTQAVTYVWQRSASLAGLFSVWALLLYFEFRLAKSPRLQRWYWAGAWCAALLAMFCKQNSFTLPLAVGLSEWIFFPDKKRPRQVWQALFSMALLLAVVPTLTLAGPTQELLDIKDLEASQKNPLNYLATQTAVILRYGWLIIFPRGQNLDHDPPLLSFGQGLPWLLALAHLGLLSAAVFWRRKAPLLAWGILFFYLCMSVESSFFPQTELMAEHRLYLPMLGIWAGFSSIIIILLRRRNLRERYFPLLFILPLILTLLTHSRNEVWSAPVRLWSDVVKKSPQKARGYANLGNALALRGAAEEAAQMYRRAIALDPKKAARAHYGLAGTYVVLQDYAAAETEFKNALAKEPTLEIAAINLGNLYARLNRSDEARRAYERALEGARDRDLAWYNLGLLYQRQAQWRKAAEAYEASIRENPKRSAPYRNLSIVYHELGDQERSLVARQKAEAIESGDLP